MSAARLAVPLIALTQLVGWGTTYYLPATLAASFVRDLGLSREVAFGGVTVMLLVGAVAAPRVGVLMDRRGLRGMLAAGSALMALALVILAASAGPVGYALAWVVVGLAMPLALTQGAVAAIARIAGGDARRAIGTMFLLSGLSATVFWPVTAALDASVGWRATCLAYAALHLLVLLPIHLLVTSRRFDPVPAGGGPAPSAEGAVVLDPGRRRVAFAWCALAFSVQGFVSWGLPLHIVDILRGFGQPTAVAVALGSLLGPAQVFARLGETLFGQRFGIVGVGLASAALGPLAVALPLAAGTSPAVAAGFVVGYGLSAGAFTIVRTVMPLALFGREVYATMIGRLAVPQNVAFAVSPIAFAAALDRFGPMGALWLGLGGTLVALGAMVALAVALRR